MRQRQRPAIDRSLLSFMQPREWLCALMIVCVTVLGGCKAYDGLRSGIEKGREAVTVVTEFTKTNIARVDKALEVVATKLDDLKGKYDELDKNQDGKVDMGELLAGLGISVGGLGGILSGRNMLSGRKKEAVQRENAARAEGLKQEIEDLKTALASGGRSVPV